MKESSDANSRSPAARVAIIVCALMLAFAGRPALAAEGDPTAHPGVTGQVTFLYYPDVSEAAHFYGNVMGFEKTLDRGWVRFFAITPTASVGLVDGSKGYHSVSEDKPVMLSVVTDDVESWYDHLRQKDVTFLKHLDDSQSPGFLRAFLVEDPGGYTVEVFEWK